MWLSNVEILLFQDTELRVWLQSEGINLLVFAGIDTSICVETSLRDGFNIGYDVALVSDATASGFTDHYKTTLERVGLLWIGNEY